MGGPSFIGQSGKFSLRTRPLSLELKDVEDLAVCALGQQEFGVQVVACTKAPG